VQYRHAGTGHQLTGGHHRRHAGCTARVAHNRHRIIIHHRRFITGTQLRYSLVARRGPGNFAFHFNDDDQLETTLRTHPSPIDLVIALAGGLAAAYALTRAKLSAALPGVAIATALMPPLCTIGVGIALGRWDVAGGATLLFITNAITIAFSAALVFFLRGLSPERHIVDHQLPRSLVISALITVTLLVPLTYYSVQFFQQANENRRIHEVVNLEVAHINAELVELNVSHSADELDMIITVRTSAALRYEQVTALQKAIVDGLQRPVSLKVN